MYLDDSFGISDFIKFNDLVIYMLLGVFIAFILFVILHLKDRFDKKDVIDEKNEIDDKIQQFVELSKTSHIDIIEMMLKNVAELREYYVISKRHASKSFSTSLSICVAGVFIYLAGIFISIKVQSNIVVMSTIAGTVVELISGLFFWLYRQSIQLLNTYHRRLSMTEKYLIAIQLIGKLSDELKDKNISFIIETIMNENKVSRDDEINS